MLTHLAAFAFRPLVHHHFRYPGTPTVLSLEPLCSGLLSGNSTSISPRVRTTRRTLSVADSYGDTAHRLALASALRERCDLPPDADETDILRALDLRLAP